MYLRKMLCRVYYQPNEKLRYQPLSRPDEIRPVKVVPGSRISPVKCELQSAILGPESPKLYCLLLLLGGCNTQDMGQLQRTKDSR